MVILAWAYELTPDGVKREKDVDPAAPRLTGDTGRRLDIATMCLAGAYRMAGQSGKAEALYRRAVELSPDFTEAHILLMGHMAERRDPAAVEAHMAAARLDERGLEAGRVLLLLARRCRQPAKAVAIPIRHDSGAAALRT